MAIAIPPTPLESCPFFRLPRELRYMILHYACRLRMFDTSVAATREVACRPQQAKSLFLTCIPLHVARLVNRQFASEYHEVLECKYQCHIIAPIRSVQNAISWIPSLGLDDPKQRLRRLDCLGITTSLTHSPRVNQAAWWYAPIQYGRNIGWQLMQISVRGPCEVKILLVDKEDERDCAAFCVGPSETARSLNIEVQCDLEEEQATSEGEVGEGTARGTSGMMDFVGGKQSVDVRRGPKKRGTIMRWYRARETK